MDDKTRIAAGDIRKGQFHGAQAIRDALGTIQPETGSDASDGPEIPSRSAISDDDRASIRKISERLGVPLTAFEELIADGEAQRDRAGGLAALLKTERETTAILRSMLNSYRSDAGQKREALDAQRTRSDAISGALKREQMRYAELHELNRALRDSASGLEVRYGESRELLAQAGIRMVALEAERDAAVAAIDTLRDMIRQRDATADDHAEQFHERIGKLTEAVAERDAIIEGRDRASIAAYQADIEARDRLLDRILDLVIDAKGGK